MTPLSQNSVADKDFVSATVSAVPTVMGIGHDAVDIAEIEEQLAASGSRFSELFSVREWRQARNKAAARGDSLSSHLAACWAGKECVVKAWTEALGSGPFPLTLDEFSWSRIEILSNSKGCPGIFLSGEYSETLAGSLGVSADQLTWKISLTHSMTLASGVALLCVREDVKNLGQAT
jgi:holo-[acyl-carrier protein] synthase